MREVKPMDWWVDDCPDTELSYHCQKIHFGYPLEIRDRLWGVTW